MAMTVTESNAFNRLMDWLFKSKGPDGKKVTDAEAREAAQCLALSSHKRLMCGITPDQVDGRWRNRRKK